MLAVTSEGASETEKWVENKGAKYAYAYDKGGKLSRYFGISGIPAAVLVDATGTVVWQGHPGSVDEGQVKQAVSGALPKPMWEWAPAAKNVRNALFKRNYKTALDEAAKLSEADGGPVIKAAIDAIVAGRVQGMKDAFGKGDFLGAQNMANANKKELAGLPQVDDAQKVLDDIGADKNAQAIIKVQLKIAKIRDGDLSKRKEIDKAIDDLKDMQKEHVGTYVAEEADVLILELNKRKKK